MTASSTSSLIPKIDFMVVCSRNRRAAGVSGGCDGVESSVTLSGWAFMTRLLCGPLLGPGRFRLAHSRVARKSENPARGQPAGVIATKARGGALGQNTSAGEDAIELLLDLHFLRLRRHGDLLDQQRARGVQHLALAERQLLVALETLQVAEHLGDLEHRARLDLLHVLAIAAVPGLTLDRDLAALEDLEHLVDLVGANQLAQTNRARVARRDHDLHPVLENLEDVERLLVAGDLTRLDADNLRNAVGWIHGQITHSESRLHDYVRSLLRTVFKARELYHAGPLSSMHSQALAEQAERRKLPRRTRQIAVRPRCGGGNRGLR